MEKNVQVVAIRTALVMDSLKHYYETLVQSIFATHQNLNSGNLRINGLNSSFDLVGKDGPSSIIKYSKQRLKQVLGHEYPSTVLPLSAFHTLPTSS